VYIFQLPAGRYRPRPGPLVHPARLPRREHGVPQDPSAARGLVDHLDAVRDRLVRQELHERSSNGAPLSTATDVSLLRKICRT